MSRPTENPADHPETIGGYRITGKLGEGGMGVVYEAVDERLRRKVAIKTIRDIAADPTQRDRLWREARMAAGINHPGICQVYEIGEAEGELFIAMEYLDGEALADHIARGSIPLSKALAYTQEMLAALGAMHSRGIVHRDLKPTNIFLTEHGVKLLDFGLARPELAAQGEQDLQITQTGAIVGTPYYMAPEQWSQGPLSPACDLFALGAILYEMLSGKPAFGGGSVLEVCRAIIKEELDPLTGGSDVMAVNRVIQRSVSKKPADRYPDAAAMAEALRSTRSMLDTANLPPPSIAVLPFTDMSPGKDQDYFCEGMAEEILGALSKIRGVRVASRSSAFRFKGQAEDIRKIGEALNVGTVLEGSVRTAGDRLRITIQLVNVDDGYQIWSERYDRQMEDVFDIQDEISESIVDALRVKLIGGEASAPARQTASLEAYHLYLKGQHNWYRREKDSLRKAARFFEDAARVDPDYVLAHTGLVISYSSLGYYGLEQSIAHPKAKAAIERAWSIDNSAAEVHAAKGLMQLWLELNWADSEQSIKRSIELDPDYALARCWYGFLLDGTGRSAEGLAMAESALEIDPLSPYVNTCVSFSLSQKGRHEEAIRMSNKALDMEPDFLFTHWVLGSALSGSARHDEAIDIFERGVNLSGRASFYLGWLAWAYGAAGLREQAQSIILELREKSKSEHVSAMFFAWAHAGLGEVDQTFEHLDKLSMERSPQVSHFAAYPQLAPLHSDPRFKRLLGEFNIPV